MIVCEYLVFHRAKGFVHQSIPAAVEAILRLGEIHGIDVEATADPGHGFDDDMRGMTGRVRPHEWQRVAGTVATAIARGVHRRRRWVLRNPCRVVDGT